VAPTTLVAYREQNGSTRLYSEHLSLQWDERFPPEALVAGPTQYVDDVVVP